MNTTQEKKLHSLDIAGVPIAYADEGSGPPVVLAHCSSGNHRMWSALTRELTGTHRVLAADFIGYGRSGRWPQGRPFEPDADLRVLMAMVEKAGGPVHLVGHSYGSALALEAGRVLGDGVRGMTLIEPVSFHLLKAGGCEGERKTIEDVARRTNAAVVAGDRRGAAAAYMGFWLGRFRWWLAPKKLKTPVIDTVDKVAMEFAAIEGLVVDSLAPYQAVRVPTLLLYGTRTRAPAKAVIRILERTLPSVRAEAIAGAGHMSPFTHQGAVNRLILAHIRDVDHTATTAAGA